MFEHILVPLDGSTMAEAALPAAAYMAERANASVTLMHTIERHAPGEVHGQRHLTEGAEAADYLNLVAARSFPGRNVNRHVHTEAVGSVAPSIVAHAQELDADLIVLCSHGGSGLRGLLFGRIAQQVIAQGTTPVLMVQPTADGSAPIFQCHNVMVTLDGDANHEQGIPIAEGLAQMCGAELHLVSVVPTLGKLTGEGASTGKLLPGAMIAVLDLAEAGVKEILAKHLIQLEAAGIRASAMVRRGDPTDMLVASALERNIDIIVMGTHGKTGLDAFWSGSITPQLSYRTTTPVLLVRVKEAASDDALSRTSG